MKLALYFILPFLTLLSLPNEEKATPYDVYVFLHDECVISRHYTIPLAEIAKEYSDIARFVGVFPNPQVDRKRMNAFSERFDFNINMISDPEFELVDRFNATVTPEVVVVDNRIDQVIYRGRIDNAYARVGRKRSVVTKHELQDVLKALRSGDESTITNQPAIGCIITKTKN